MALKLLRQFFFYAVLVGIWYLISSVHYWPSYQFPSPGQVGAALQGGILDGSIIQAVGVSVRRLLIGYSVAIVFGVFLGVVIGKFKVLDETVGGLVLGMQALPSICWLPLASLWFGMTEMAILFVVFQGSILAITIGTDSGIKNIPRLYIQMGKNMGAKGHQMFFEVILPASLPSIVGGFKQGWVFAWRSLMAGEMLFVSMGLGNLLNTGRQMNDISLMLAVMIMIVILGILVESLVFGIIQRRIKKIWGFS